jgi:hypothetical protein
MLPIFLDSPGEKEAQVLHVHELAGYPALARVLDLADEISRPELSSRDKWQHLAEDAPGLGVAVGHARPLHFFGVS